MMRSVILPALVAALLVLSACAAFKPPEFGNPEQGALVIFDGHTHSKGLFGEDRDAAAVGAILDSSGSEVRSDTFAGLVLFPNLKPGHYKIRTMAVVMYSGQSKQTLALTFGDKQIEKVDGLQFDVAPGQVYYAGPVRVDLETSMFKQVITDVSVEPNPGGEKAALQTLLAKSQAYGYQDSPWLPRIRARMEALQ